MDQAIKLAQENAAITADEIKYLRKQLVIGGSTLDSVLSAEARLYDAESKGINFQAEKYKAQLTILSALGLLSKSLGLNAGDEQS
jgi:outer membrane protein TolC